MGEGWRMDGRKDERAQGVRRVQMRMDVSKTQEVRKEVVEDGRKEGRKKEPKELRRDQKTLEGRKKKRKRKQGRSEVWKEGKMKGHW